MSAIEHFERLFSYDQWANREVLRVLPLAPTRSRELLAHVLSAERLWWERIHQQTQSLPVWPNFTLDECERQVKEVSDLWREFSPSFLRAALAKLFCTKTPSVRAGVTQ